MSTDHREERFRRAAERAVAAYPELPSWKRRVLTRFLVESRRGWHTCVHEAFPDAPAAEPDVLLIGPLGVLAIALRDKEPEWEDVRAAVRRCAELFLGARAPAGSVTEAVVRPVVVLPTGRGPANPSIGHHLTVADTELDRVLRRGERRLGRRDAQSLVEHLGARAGFTPLTPGAARDPAEPDAELFDVADLSRDRFDAALDGPFEAWLTFLDDEQAAMVRRDYSGPARISGPAGTGKSAVALHRLVHLARRSVGPLLFTTYARNLPPIARRLFHRLAPEIGDRVEFSTVHRWAKQFLHERGRAVDVRPVASCFALAWSQFGKNTRLAELNPRPDYWQDEIDRVIKGRGIADLTRYQALNRVGRGMGIERGADRALVWQLYETYERIRADKGVLDFNDVLTAAHAELERRGLDRPLAGVVVDEVQDITLVGLRLLHALAGDGPNRLLLVGDGQQQIYPGGWRLSDAGIPIRGRGEVLRTNYRNASRILECAKRFDASNQVDDLDGAAGFSLREAVATLRGGDVIWWTGAPEQHEEALVGALRRLDVEPDDVAVLTFGKVSTTRWLKVLRAAGFAARDLEHYEGERDGKVRVGTVHRAKGLEFRAVLVPEIPAGPGVDERRRDQRERDERTQLVALTRARDVLWVGRPHREGAG
ncbi:UvrD-helicase domain-containing protein [Saccharopolyspora sp. MS10]|uniref:UvrD-helicase domain-containing protein n=1 Tax=Saccharopolyspora sp. MS10 TaxID=3385973 RepID=UPI0039A3A5EF